MSTDERLLDLAGGTGVVSVLCMVHHQSAIAPVFGQKPN